MKISILCPNLSSNALGRAYVLAKILQQEYEIEIIGPVSKEGIWGVVSYDKSIKIISGRTRQLLGKISGDIIFASKPLVSSFGIGIFKKIFSGKKLLLDIDDWQLGFVKHKYKPLSIIQKLKRLLSDIKPKNWNSALWNNWLCEKLLFFADEIIVSNTFLQKRFTGEIIWHARDKNLFRPGKYNRLAIRERLGVKSAEKIILFLGTPSPHKGFEDLIAAVELIRNKNVKLMLLGLQKGSYIEYIKNISEKRLADRFIGVDLKPIYMAPEYLSAADMVVIPQRKNYASLGQIPAKLFDAMAMAKPIIATSVNDMPEILKGCGWIVKPGNPEAIASTILHVLNHPLEAQEAGKRARIKFEREYSLQQMSGKLLRIVNQQAAS